MEGKVVNEELLYHYTTLDTLALILQGRKIKFNPLCNMDDKQEAMLQDPYDIAKYIFISSWTSESKENIAMWKLYSNVHNGVRIGLKRNPFKKYIFDPWVWKKEYPHIAISVRSSELILPTRECISEEFSLLNHAWGEVLEKVIYTDDNSLLFPKTVEIGPENTTFKSNGIGKYKNTYWEFQNEERYILRFAPVGLRAAKQDDNAAQMFVDGISPDVHFRDAIFLEIDDEAFEKMEVTIAPEFTMGSRVIIESLKSTFNPNMKINESVLNGFVRL